MVCLNCHSRVTGNEGLGQRYSQAEVLAYKVAWESEISKVGLARDATLVELAEWSERFGGASASGNGGEKTREYNYIHHELAGAVWKQFVGSRHGARFEHSDLERMVTALDKAGVLARSRPQNIDEYRERPFVLEKMKATKVYFPPGFLKQAVPSLKELVVWVSEPDSEALHTPLARGWNFDGTFLYVIGSFWEDQGPGTFFSGCSALQVIANVIGGEPAVRTNWEEPYGRRSFLHPVEKLKHMRGFVMDSREYEMLYRSRYMSDEQCFVQENRGFRVHDLLAYPIFVALIS